MTSVCTSAQQSDLSGYYNTYYKGWRTLQFSGQDSFYFDGWYRNQEFRGRGKFEVNDKWLYLYFENAPDTVELLQPPIVTVTGKPASASTIRVECVHKDLPYSYILVNAITRPGYYDGAFTDSSGQVKLMLSNRAFPVTLTVSEFSMEAEKIVLDSAADYSVKVFLRQKKRWQTRYINTGRYIHSG